jgi:hypothetical protein
MLQRRAKASYKARLARRADPKTAEAAWAARKVTPPKRVLIVDDAPKDDAEEASE